MANKKNRKSKNSPEYVWELLAPQADYLFGAFTSLNAAYNAACKLAEPDQALKETKQQMPLHHHDNKNNKEFYLLWDQSDGDWYKDAPLFRITKLKIGKVYKDYDGYRQIQQKD